MLSLENRAANLEDLQALSIPEFCERLGGLSPWTARSWIRDGKLKSLKIFGRRMIPMSELRRALAGNLNSEGREDAR